MSGPRLPLPEPLRGADPGSFTEFTLNVRLPDLVRHVLEEGDWTALAAGRLQALAEEIPQAQVRPLVDDEAPDAAEWRAFVAPYQGLSWLQAPWFFAEAYLFRRILEASGYFQPGLGQGVDPYIFQKRQGMRGTPQGLAPLLSLSDSMPTSPLPRIEERVETLTSLLTTSVWANQADLGMWPAGSERKPGRLEAEGRDAHLLVNQAAAAARHLARLEGGGSVALILDNYGLELASDLALVDFLLRAGLARSVQCYPKLYPTYVSDATLPDVLEMLDNLERSGIASASSLARRVQGCLAGGSLSLRAHAFWNTPLAGWEMPPDLRQELGRFDLLISKGDANYRRWLGDRHWDFSTPPEEVLGYLPAPWLALRIFKAEIALGLSPGFRETMDQTDPQWMYNGKWAMIQYVDPGSSDP